MYFDNNTVTRVDPTGLADASYFTQWMFDEANGFEPTFAGGACYATSILNLESQKYTQLTDNPLSDQQAFTMMHAGITSGQINPKSAFVGNNQSLAASSMWAATGAVGNWTYSYSNGYNPANLYSVFQIAGHFEGNLNSANTEAYDPATGLLNQIINGSIYRILPVPVVTQEGVATPETIISTRIFTFAPSSDYSPISSSEGVSASVPYSPNYYTPISSCGN